MAIFNIYLDLDKEYLELIKDSYKTIVILAIFQLLVIMSNSTSNNIIENSLKGSFLNDNFMTLLIFVLIGYCGYYLVMDKIINFE